MCVAKGLTGGYLPLAATFATQKIFDAFLGDPWDGRTFFHGHTYTGNPLACAVAIASLDLFEQNDLLADVRRKTGVLAELLEPLKALPHVGDVRQKGLMVGIELVADQATRTPFDRRRRVGAAVCQRARGHGVIVRRAGRRARADAAAGDADRRLGCYSESGADRGGPTLTRDPT